MAAEGNRVLAVNGINVGAVIDCTGGADVGSAVGADCLATDETTQAPAVIFPLRNVTRPLRSPAEAAQVLLPLARAGLPPLNLQPNLEPQTVTAKFSGRADQVLQLIEFLARECQRVRALRNHADGISRRSPRGPDDCGRIYPHRRGRAGGAQISRCGRVLRVAHRTMGRKDGMAKFRYLPAGCALSNSRPLIARARIENLFMAGKTISADVDAIASARVMGCCLATGEAAGKLGGGARQKICRNGGAR